MKVDAMIRVREGVEVVVRHTLEIEFVQQSERALHMNVVIRHAVHHEEADVALESSHVGDSSILEATRIVLRCVHVTLRIDGVCQ